MCASSPIRCSARVSPVSFAGPKRFHRVPATIAQLPRLDAVLLSHDHFDHLCQTSMRELARLRVPIVTSLGLGVHLEKFGVDPGVITEALDWWETHTMPGGRLAFTATPAQHFSGRGLGRNATLWSSWVIQADRHRLFFSGDTGLTDEFSAIGRRALRRLRRDHAGDRRVPPGLGQHPPGPRERAAGVRAARRRHVDARALGHFRSGAARVGRACGDAGHARAGTCRARSHPGARPAVRAIASRGPDTLVARPGAARGEGDGGASCCANPKLWAASAEHHPFDHLRNVGLGERGDAGPHRAAHHEAALPRPEDRPGLRRRDAHHPRCRRRPWRP